MSRRFEKRKEDESRAFEGEDRPKKTTKTDESDESDGIVVCELSKNRRVSVRIWQGKPVLDIREFYVKDGKQMPGKKGISLPMDQWHVLREHAEEIDKALS